MFEKPAGFLADGGFAQPVLILDRLTRRGRDVIVYAPFWYSLELRMTQVFFA
jgi:hypothetical protein